MTEITHTMKVLYGLRALGVWGVLLSPVIAGCVPVVKNQDNTAEQSQKTLAASYIVTPPKTYSTHKARDLGTAYQKNLESLVKRIQENFLTKGLRLTNNIQALGGLGFFTQSASKVPDDRYLEVAVTIPEIIPREDLRTSIDRVVAKYGRMLLAILSDDSEIFADKRVVGYGLNFSWQGAPAGETADKQTVVIYLPKEKAMESIRKAISQEQLLKESVMFEIKGERSPTRYYYNPR